MGQPIIGYRNFFTEGTTSTDEEAVGFEHGNAFTGTTYDFWQTTTVGATRRITVDMGSAVSANYFALAAHNLGNISATAKVQYSSDNFGVDINDAAATLFTTTKPFIFTFTAPTARYWRIEINPGGGATDPIRVGAATIGTTFDLIRAYSQGMTIPYDGINDKITNQVSNGGSFLGRSIIRQGIQASISVTYRDIAFARGNWRDFIEASQTRPFWFSWNSDYNSDVVYVWRVGNPAPPTYDTNKTLRASIKIAGLRT